MVLISHNHHPLITLKLHFNAIKKKRVVAIIFGKVTHSNANCISVAKQLVEIMNLDSPIEYIVDNKNSRRQVYVSLRHLFLIEFLYLFNKIGPYGPELIWNFGT